MSANGESRTVSVEEIENRFCVEQVERARELHLRLMQVCFENGISSEIITPQGMLNLTDGILRETKADPGDLSLGELGITLDVLLARLGVSQDWELANSLLGLPATAAEVLPVKARKEAEFWQRADEGLKRLGERLGLPLPQQPYYPAGHGDEYS